METIAVYGTKGGAGTTVVAAAIAIERSGTLDSPDACAVLGRPDGSPEVALGAGPLVEDRGVVTTTNRPNGKVPAILVTRACYLGLRSALRTDLSGFRGVVLVEEPGRALGVGDVEATLDLPVLAIVPWEPSVARAVDSGLLEARMPVSLRRMVARLKSERI